MKTLRWARARRHALGLAAAGLLAWPVGCTEPLSPDDAMAMVQYMPLAVVVPKGEELKRAEEYAAKRPDHFAYLAVMARPLFPYGERAGIVAHNLDWSELKRGMTIVYLAQRDGMVGGMAAGVLIEKVDGGWTFKSWGYDDLKPTRLTPVAYLGVVVVAFVTEQDPRPPATPQTSFERAPSPALAVTLNGPSRAQPQ